ncbi:Histone deacetylase 6, partial [Halocaridina rubra]
IVDSVLKGESLRGLAIVRPPGHHAERNEPCGFCFYNNVAVGAKHAINAFGMERILILDWDIHHGNGIQHMFEAEPRVLYISIHRYENGSFFPYNADANYNRVGIKKGKGFNVNIPWNKGGMHDGDYMAAMMEVVLPIATQFNPQLVLVSAGFDAAVGDPLGATRKLKGNGEYRDITIQYDLTRAQRENMKILISEAKRKEQEDQSANLIYRERGPPEKNIVKRIKKQKVVQDQTEGGSNQA